MDASFIDFRNSVGFTKSVPGIHTGNDSPFRYDDELIMTLGDGIRRNILTVSAPEQQRFVDAIVEPKGKHHDNKEEKDKSNEEKRKGLG